MKNEVRGKRARGFGISGFVLFGLLYLLYSYLAIRGAIRLVRQSAEGQTIIMSLIAFGIELVFSLALVAFSVIAVVKYSKKRMIGAFPHMAKLIMVYALYSFLNPIYSKYLRPGSGFDGFELIHLVTTPTGLLLIASLMFSILSLLVVNKSKKIHHFMFCGVVLPIFILEGLTIIWTFDSYGHYWMYDQHMTIFAPWVRILAMTLVIIGYFFEKKVVTAESKE